MNKDVLNWEYLLCLSRFKLADSDNFYYIKKGTDEIEAYNICDYTSNEVVGWVTRTFYSFKIWTRVHGLTLSKEIEFKDIIVMKW